MRSRCLLGAVCSMAMLVGAIPPAWAEDPEVFYPSPKVNVWADLDFVRERNASICPGEQWFRDLVGAEQGDDSFKPDPRGVYVGRVRVVMSRAPGGFAAAYVWVDAQGVEHHARYTQRGDTWFHCREAMQYAVMDLTIQFDEIERELGEKYAKKTPHPYCPAAPSAQKSETDISDSKTTTPCPPPPPDSRTAIWPNEWPPPPPEPPLPPLEKPKPDPPKKLESWPLAVRLGIAMWPELVASGWGSLGFTGEAGVRYHAVSLNAEVHGDPSLGPQPFAGSSVSFARLSGAILLCGQFGWFEGCGVVEDGRFFFPNHIEALPSSTFYGAAGVRTGINFPVAPPWLFLSTAFNVLAPIHPADYVQMGRSYFQVAGPGVGLGLGLRIELPFPRR